MFSNDNKVMEKLLQIKSAVLNRALGNHKEKLVRLKTVVRQRTLINRKDMVIKVRKSLTVFKMALAQETEETKVMVSIYQRYTKGLATEEEMQQANEQFKDVLKAMGLSVVVVLPFAPITIPAIVKLGEKVGVDVLPSSFKNMGDEAPSDTTNKASEEVIAITDTTILVEEDSMATSDMSSLATNLPANASDS